MDKRRSRNTYPDTISGSRSRTNNAQQAIGCIVTTTVSIERCNHTRSATCRFPIRCITNNIREIGPRVRKNLSDGCKTISKHWYHDGCISTNHIHTKCCITICRSNILSGYHWCYQLRRGTNSNCIDRFAKSCISIMHS